MEKTLYFWIASLILLVTLLIILLVIWVAKLKVENAKLKRMAYYDPLTSLVNRWHWMPVLENECRRSERESKPLAILMLDLDDFRRFNDRYGHVEGDKCLQRVATIIKNTLKRPGDMVGRYGGEEFIVILPETNYQGAIKVAEEILISVRKDNIVHADNLEGIVTISIGVSVKNPKKDLDWEAMIKAADRALYAAKLGGKNRISPRSKTVKSK